MTEQEIQVLKTISVEGKHVNLRVASPSDAEFILELRLNPALNRFIGKTDPDVENQRNWIDASYEKTTEFHFIIEDKEGIPYGTIAIYDIDYEKGVAEWGRWILKTGSPAYFTIESNLLAFYVAFDMLGLKKLVGGANNENKKVVAFHKTYVTVTSIDEQHTWFEVEDANYKKYLKTFKDFHNIPF
jgi:RimJ/RimL family protein N-acetyltransferase